MNPDTGNPVHISLFAPTDLADYTRRLRLNLTKRLFPLR